MMIIIERSQQEKVFNKEVISYFSLGGEKKKLADSNCIDILINLIIAACS